MRGGVHAFNSRTQGAEAGDFFEFKANLVYPATWRRARATKETLSQK